MRNNKHYIQNNNLTNLFLLTLTKIIKMEFAFNNVFHSIVRDETGKIMMDNSNMIIIDK